MQFHFTNTNRWTAVAGLGLALALFLPACGGGSSSSVAPAPDTNPGYTQADLAGDWNGILSSGDGDVVAYLRFDDQGQPLEIVDALGHSWSYLDSTASVSVTSTGQIQVTMSQPNGDQAEAAFAGNFTFGGLMQQGDYILDGGRTAGGIGPEGNSGPLPGDTGASGKAIAGNGGGGNGNYGAYDPPDPWGPGTGQQRGFMPKRDGRQVGHDDKRVPGAGDLTRPGQHGLPDPGTGGDPGVIRDGRDVDNFSLDNGPGGARNRGLDPWGRIGHDGGNTPPGEKQEPPPSVSGDSNSTQWRTEGGYQLSWTAVGTYSALTHTQGRWNGTLTMADGTVHNVLLTVAADGTVIEGSVGNLEIVTTDEVPFVSFTFAESSVGAIRNVVMPLSDGSTLEASVLLVDPDGTMLQGSVRHSVAGDGFLDLRPLQTGSL